MEEDMKYCPHCGKPIKAAARKCIHCRQWVDGGPDQQEQSDSAGSTSSSALAIKAIFGVLAFAVLGILIYALVGNDKKSDGYDSDVSYNEHVEEKESRSYDDDDHDTYSRSYDDDYRSSSSSSYGGSSYSSERIVDCPVCHGTGIDGDEECIPCSGSGQLVTDDDCGSCHKNCGCTVYLAQRGYDFCVFCLMLDCHSTRDDHLK